MNEHIDMKISGSSSMPGGEYGKVSISGAGKVQGSLKCEEMHCSGASNVQGDVDCAGELCTSGAGKVAGSVRCGSLTSSGSFSAQSVRRGARVRLRFTADGAGAYGRRAPCVRLSGGRQRPLPGAPFFRRVPGQRRRRGRDGGLERCSRDRRTSERGDSRDLGQPRGAHQCHRRRNYPRPAEGHGNGPRYLPHKPRLCAHRLDRGRQHRAGECRG